MLKKWDKAAKIRREQIEKKLDLTLSEVFCPFYTDIISKESPTSVIEIGSGTGHLALHLSKKVKKYIGIEPSKGMFDVAQKVLKESNVELINDLAENISPLETYDLLLSHMCLQTIENIDEILHSISLLMDEKSVFVFSIPHPCFWNNYSKWGADDYEYMNKTYGTVHLKITKDPENQFEIPYAHRPLQHYFHSLNKNNLCVSNLTEIFPEENIQALYGKPWKEPRYIAFFVVRAT
ncbi:MAG: SAM-dependent methyltransferase [Chlamydiales bacterium]|jgi:SAM-dependent methyltransferase